jgi:hypothetical protein
MDKFPAQLERAHPDTASKVGTSRCDVPARVPAPIPSRGRLTLRSATGTAQRACPYRSNKGP